MFYLFEGFILMMVALDQSGIKGRHAMELGLPFGWLAESIWIIVPILFIALSIPRFRQVAGFYQHFVHPITFVAILLPTIIFSWQTESIPLRDSMNHVAVEEVRDRYNDTILFVTDSRGRCVYIPKSLDRDEVAATIYAIDPSVDPGRVEPTRALKP